MRWVFDDGQSTEYDANWILAPDDISDERAVEEYDTTYGWVWTSVRKLNKNSGYAAVLMFDDDYIPAVVFDTLEEAKVWLEAAVVYVKVTGEIPPRDIHKREGV